MPRILPKFDFSLKFQTKLVRALFQFPDEGRDILERSEPAMFDSKPAAWTIAKLKHAFIVAHVPASMTVLEYEAVRDARFGLIDHAHVSAYARFLAGLSRPVPEKTYILGKAHEFLRHTYLRRFIVDTAKRLVSDKPIDWERVNRSLDEQRHYCELVGDTGLGHDFFDAMDDRFERRKNFERLGVPTGIDFVDSHMRHGGLPPKQVGCVMAGTGVGKTSCLVFMAGSAVKSGRRVAYVSLELDEDMIGERFDARLTGIPLGGLASRPNRARSKLREVMAADGSLRIKYYPPESLDMAGLRSYLRRLQASSFYPDILFIDYADHMSLKEYGHGSNESDYGPLGRLYNALRGVAGEYNIPIWTASQTNRNAAGKSVLSVHDMADSFRKAMVSDFVLAVARLSEDGEGKKRGKNGQAMPPLAGAMFAIAKNRNGITGMNRVLRFDTSRIAIEEP